MTRRNRIDPWGDLHAVAARGMFTGNRGCLVDDDGALTRHHHGTLWITCLTSFRDWRHPLDAPRTWTPLFFLDDAVALAAGHRPCGLCRRDDYLAYQRAVSGDGERVLAPELNRRLSSERLRRGRGLDRRDDRKLWTARPFDLPTGTVTLDRARRPHLLIGGALRPFEFTGWGPPVELVDQAVVHVLTPPTSVAALRHGFTPTLAL